MTNALVSSDLSHSTTNLLVALKPEHDNVSGSASPLPQ
jgi:hypothetical protein